MLVLAVDLLCTLLSYNADSSRLSLQHTERKDRFDYSLHIGNLTKS